MRPPVVHQCPPGDAGVTPCCGLPVFELLHSDRISVDAALVTCWTASDPRIGGAA